MLWKSSLLPLLFYEWEGRQVASGEVVDKGDAEEMAKVARRQRLRIDE